VKKKGKNISLGGPRSMRYDNVYMDLIDDGMDWFDQTQDTDE
jgi:hypothetical protein